jgi:Protein of unknown function (DUF3313)
MAEHRSTAAAAVQVAERIARRRTSCRLGMIGMLLAMLPVAGARAQVEEGLVRAQVEGLRSVYVQPQASLAGYSRVMLDPIEVAFAPGWDPRPAGRPIAARDRERIRAELAALLRAEFVQEIETRGHYRFVDQAGADVLRVRAEIRDLSINAPDTQTAANIDHYTLSVGEMTLVAELRDSVSGALVARVIDRRRDPERLRFERTTRIDNVAAARRAGRHWAQILHLAGTARP